MSKVIDIHAHFFPQRFVEAIKEVSKDYGGKVTWNNEERFVIHLKGIDMGPIGDECSELPARAVPQSHGRKSVVRGLLDRPNSKAGDEAIEEEVIQDSHWNAGN